MAVLAFTFFFGRFGEEEFFVRANSFLAFDGIVACQVSHDFMLSWNAPLHPLSSRNFSCTGNVADS